MNKQEMLLHKHLIFYDLMIQSQTKAEILNSLGLIAKKCSDVSIKLFLLFSFLIISSFKYDQAILTYNEALRIVDTTFKSMVRYYFKSCWYIFFSFLVNNFIF